MRASIRQRYPQYSQGCVFPALSVAHDLKIQKLSALLRVPPKMYGEQSLDGGACDKRETSVMCCVSQVPQPEVAQSSSPPAAAARLFRAITAERPPTRRHDCPCESGRGGELSAPKYPACKNAWGRLDAAFLGHKALLRGRSMFEGRFISPGVDAGA